MVSKNMSLPPRGAWIEIKSPGIPFLVSPLSLPPRGAWIEILPAGDGFRSGRLSLPPRGAWIEMLRMAADLDSAFVAPPAGSVD